MLKSNLRQFLTYAIGSVSQTALGFLLLPLYLRRLTPGEYGMVSVLITINGVVSLVAGSGVLSGLVRLYYSQTLGDRRAMAGTVVIWMTSTSLVLTLLLFIIAKPLSLLLFSKPDYITEMRAAGLLLFVSCLQASFYILLRLEKRATEFVAISIVGFLTDMGLKIYLIGIQRWGVGGYFVSSILSTTLTVAAAAYVGRHDLRLSLRRDLLRPLLTLGFPFVFSGFGMWVLDISDRLILNAFVGPEPVGIYTLGYKFASIFNILLLGPLGLFWAPFLFSYGAEQGDEAVRRVCSRSFTTFALAGSLLLVGVSIGGPDLIRLLARNSAYFEASELIPFLSLAPFFYMMAFPAGSAILQSNQVRYSSYAMIAAALVNLALNLVLIPRFSLNGATAATVVGYGVLVGLQYHWAQRVFPASYNWWRAAKSVGCAVMSIFVAMQIHIADPIISLLTREAIGFSVFIPAALLIGGVGDNDLKFVRDLVSRPGAPLSVGSQGVSP